MKLRGNYLVALEVVGLAVGKALLKASLKDNEKVVVLEEKMEFW